LQCGGVQPSNVRICTFCESPLVVDFVAEAQDSELRSRDHLDHQAIQDTGSTAAGTASTDSWRGELAERLQAYRVRRKKAGPNAGQSKFSFESAPLEPPLSRGTISVAEPAPAESVEDPDFAFTIAIGRNAATRQDPRMMIDLSQPPVAIGASQAQSAVELKSAEVARYPVASVEERRLAGLIDAACLLFAYGGFLALFGSVAGQFTLSKLSLAICASTFVIVYLQYFALFTVFGGTTPGMMMRGLHVVSFSGEPPTPRQMLWRSAGYMLSAGAFFMGFLWAIWDEDGLTWHDRLSRTYLCPAPTLADMDATRPAHTP
jgi:uncharacterized RDD family membrane protein YckC